MIALNAECGGQVDDPPLYGPCDLSKPFGPLVPLQGLEAPFADPHPFAEMHPSLSPDELTIYFSYEWPARVPVASETDKIFVASRPTVNDGFSSPVRVDLALPPPPGPLRSTCGGSNFSTCQGFTSPSISRDGLSLYFLFDQYVGVATRPSTQAPFHEWRWVRTGNSDAGASGFVETDDGSVTISFDGQTLYTTQHTGIFRSVWSSSGWAPLEPIPFASGAADKDLFQFAVARDDLSLYAIGGSLSDPNFHIYIASRAADSPFGQPVVLPEFDSSERVGLDGNGYPVGLRRNPAWLSLDGCRLYMDADDSDAPISVARRGP